MSSRLPSHGFSQTQLSGARAEQRKQRYYDDYPFTYFRPLMRSTLTNFLDKLKANLRGSFKVSFTLIALGVISGCNLLPSQSSLDSLTGGEEGLGVDQQDATNIEEHVEDLVETIKPDPPPRPFEPETLFNLLVGELAVLEQDLASGVNLYSHEARESRDAGVAQRAALLARYHRDSDSALEMAELWYEVDPESANAAKNYADILARTNRPLEAVDVLEAAHLQDIDVNFEVLRNGRMSPAQREQILNRLAPLNAKKHSNQSLIFTYTLLLQNSDRNEEALAQVERLRSMVNNSRKLALLEASLLSRLERHQDASKTLKAELDRDPNRRLHIQYARSLAKHDMAQAEIEFAALLEKSPKDVKLLMAHSLAAIENRHFDASKKSLEQLISMHRSLDFSHYHLGEIAAQEKQLEAAIEHYKQVQVGEYFPSATQAILEIHRNNQQNEAAIAYLELLRSQFPQYAASLWSFESAYYRKVDNLDAAYQALSQGIHAIPSNSRLRIERSYVSDLLNRVDLAEDDLRWVIEQEPNNASALNALGYMLTTKTDRYNEALELIERAIILQPEDPAIRDSLGWVYYKLGRHDEAETELVRAFQAFPDDEIAAHLIELYWKTNQKEKAKELYRSLKKQEGEFPKVEALLKELTIRW